MRACPEQAIDFTYQVDLTRCKSHRACVKACGSIGAIDFGRAASTRTESFDLVFDLSAQPLLKMPEKPFGYQAPGDVPIRRSGRDGRYPAAGWDSRNDWTGRLVPFEQLPSRLNPAEGFVVSANQAVTEPGYPFLLKTRSAMAATIRMAITQMTAVGSMSPR